MVFFFVDLDIEIKIQISRQVVSKKTNFYELKKDAIGFSYFIKQLE